MTREQPVVLQKRRDAGSDLGRVGRETGWRKTLGSVLAPGAPNSHLDSATRTTCCVDPGAPASAGCSFSARPFQRLSVGETASLIPTQSAAVLHIFAHTNSNLWQKGREKTFIWNIISWCEQNGEAATGRRREG